MLTVKIDDSDYTVFLNDDGSINPIVWHGVCPLRVCPDKVMATIKRKIDITKIVSNLPVVGVHTYFAAWIDGVYCAGKTVGDLINDYNSSPWRV